FRSTSTETSVNELARLLMKVSGRTVETKYAPARPGEVQHSCIATDKLKSLGWQCGVTIEEGRGRTYRHIARGVARCPRCCRWQPPTSHRSSTRSRPSASR